MQFPPGYPSELKKYGYPPPFPPGYPPEQYEKYGYPPRSAPSEDQTHTSANTQTSQEINNHPSSQSSNGGDLHGYPTVMFPWGPGAYVPIAGNVYNSGFNVNHSGTQSSGDVKVGNRNNN